MGVLAHSRLLVGRGSGLSQLLLALACHERLAVEWQPCMEGEACAMCKLVRRPWSCLEAPLAGPTTTGKLAPAAPTWCCCRCS